jgi:hypothetical protein
VVFPLRVFCDSTDQSSSLSSPSSSEVDEDMEQHENANTSSCDMSMTSAEDSGEQLKTPESALKAITKKQKGPDMTGSMCFVLVIKYYYLMHEDVTLLDILKL